MATNTTVTQKRGGTTIQTGIGIQIDTNNLDERNFDGGAAPYDQFDCYIRFGAGLTVLRNDQLIDEANGTDVYTVNSRPESFPAGSLQFQAFMPIGS